MMISQKYGRQGAGPNPLYVYIEKYILLRNNWPDYIDIWQEYSLGNPIASF